MFVHLHCHSHYSFLRGVASPDEIIAAAVEQKMPAVALTDTNGMYAAVEFYQAAKKAGIKEIVGVTIDVQWRVASGEKETERFFVPQNHPDIPPLVFSFLATRHSPLATPWCCWRRIWKGTAICASS